MTRTKRTKTIAQLISDDAMESIDLTTPAVETGMGVEFFVHDVDLGTYRVTVEPVSIGSFENAYSDAFGKDATREDMAALGRGRIVHPRNTSRSWPWRR
jgi:hypothetical protein